MICDDSLLFLSSGTGAHRAGLDLSAVSVFKWKDTTKRMSNTGNKKNTLTCKSKEWINTVWRASAVPLPSPPPARPAESVACWDRGSACRGSTMAGGWIWDPPLVLVLAGRPSQSAQHSWIPHKPPWLRLQSAASLLTSERRNMFISDGPRCLSAFVGQTWVSHHQHGGRMLLLNHLSFKHRFISCLYSVILYVWILEQRALFEMLSFILKACSTVKY